MPLTAYRVFKKIMDNKTKTVEVPKESPRGNILTEIRKEAQKFHIENYKLPTKIVIHPMTLMEVIEAAGHGEWSIDHTSEKLGASTIYGLEVEQSLSTNYFFVQ